MKLNMNMTMNTNTSVPVRRFCFLVGAMLLVCGAASAQQKIELKEHRFSSVSSANGPPRVNARMETGMWWW
jgi:hypothetical protein